MLDQRIIVVETIGKQQIKVSRAIGSLDILLVSKRLLGDVTRFARFSIVFLYGYWVAYAMEFRKSLSYIFFYYQ